MRWCFLDRIDELIPGEKARGRKGVANSEDYFADHFPGFPVVPGVIQVEALAQLAGKLIEVTLYGSQGRWVWPILSIVRKAKFRRFVRPGDPLVLEIELAHLREESALVKAKASVEGKCTTQAELVFVFNPADLDTEKAQQKLEDMEREHLSYLWDGYDAWCESVE